jgi:YVTN family beta-propeller protein
VSRFNADTFEEGAVRTVSVGEQPVAIAFGAGALWVANAGDGTVTRIDPSTHSTSTIEVGGRPVDVEALPDAIWVAGREGRISRIDPGQRRVVKTIEAGNALAGIAAGGGHVWAAVQAT